MSANAKARRNLCERMGEDHDVELYETNREWHIYRCMRCNKIITTVPRDFTPEDVTLEKGNAHGR